MRGVEERKTIEITINGAMQAVEAGLTLAGLIERLQLQAERVAIELNLEIISRSRWPETTLNNGDRLEIVHFVGGGTIG